MYKMSTIKLVSIISLVSNSFCSTYSVAGKIHQAARYGAVREVEEALVGGDQVNSPISIFSGTFLPIHLAVLGGNYDSVKLLVENGAAFNAITSIHGAPIHIAVKEGRRDIVEFLLDQGADVNSKSPATDTPLHLAAKYGYIDIAKLLIERGAIIDESDNDFGETPLMTAIKSSRYVAGACDVAELLFQNGADLSIVNANNESLRQIVIMKAYNEKIWNLVAKYTLDTPKLKKT